MNLGTSYRCLSRCVQTNSGISMKRRDHSVSSRTDSVSFEALQSPVTPSLQLDRKHQHRTRALQQQSTLVNTMKGHNIQLPIDYFQLLGLHPGENVLKSKVLEAFNRLSSEKVEEGFSALAMTGRQQLLEEAKEAALKHIEHKTGPIESTKRLDLSSHLFSGALSLLVDVSQYDLVLQMGSLILESSDVGNMKRDILLAMTLAKLGQAQDAISVPNQVALACTRMEEALSLLNAAGSPPLAPDLSEEIEYFLETDVPNHVLVQLKLPLSEVNTKGRKEAIYIVQGLLQVPKYREYTFVGVDRHYVKQTMDCLTSVEVLNSIDWGTVLRDPKSVNWYYPGLLLKGASVYIVIGFLERKPALLRSLDSILNLPGKDREAHVEHAICKVLLGEVEQAFEILERNEGSNNSNKLNVKEEEENEELSSFGYSSLVDQSLVGAKLLPGRNEILAFVRANSGDNPNDYLPGLCLFVERWLQHAGFSQFRDLSDPVIRTTLVDYFKDRKVEKFLNSNSGAQKRLFGMIINKNKNDANKEPPPRVLDQSEAESNRFLKDGQFKAPPGYEDVDFDKQSFGFPFNFGILRNPAILGALLGGTVLASALFALLRNPWIRHQSKEAFTSTTTTQEMNSKNKDTLTLKREDHKMKKETTMRKQRLRKQTNLTRKDAEYLIRKWQFAKAKALGPEHDFHYMKKVLVSPMLETWTANIQRVQERGWYWEYKLKSCKVTNVIESHSSDDQGLVEVHATLKERATMFGRAGKALDQYNSQYHVIYQMIANEQGQWRIKSVEIVRQQR